MNDPNLQNYTRGDILLDWMSWQRSGTLEKLRSTVSTFYPSPLSLSQVNLWLHLMHQLGHCEIDWLAGRWKVEPPRLHQIAGDAAIAFRSGAVGYGTKNLFPPSEWNVLSIQPQGRILPSALLPTTFFIQFSLDELSEIEEDTHHRFHFTTFQQQCSTLRSLEQPANPDTFEANSRLKSAMERLILRRRLSSNQDPYEPKTGPIACLLDGSYRWKEQRRSRYGIIRDGELYPCGLEESVFHEIRLKRDTDDDYESELRSLLRWCPDHKLPRGVAQKDDALGKFIISSGLHLPFKQAKTLIYCSGLPPRLSGSDRRTWIYDNVPYGIARHVGKSLGYDHIEIVREEP